MSPENGTNTRKEENQKVIGNAISAYLLIFVSFLFLFNKTNKHINNNFVKNHVKSAFTIHMSFLITYIIFISNKLFAHITFFGLTLNTSVASGISLFLLGILVYGMYKAHKGESLKIGELIHVVHKEQLIDIDGDSKFDEKDKLTILIAYIPLLGYFNFAKYSQNQVIQNATNINLIITLIISILSFNGYGNLALLFFLFYIIFVVFVGISLFGGDKLIDINTKSFPTPSKIRLWLFSSFRYLFGYFTENKDINFQKTLTDQVNRDIQKEIGKKVHKRNTIIITLLIIFNILGSYFNIITNFLPFFIFPILFWVGYIKQKKEYRIPFIYDIYELFNLIFGKIKDFNKKYNKTVEGNFKVK